MAELCEARRRHQADPAGADHAYRLLVSHQSIARCSTGKLAAELAQRPGDREHLVLVERLQERVVDPVRRLSVLPGDQTQAVAVLEEHVLPTLDLLRLG